MKLKLDKNTILDLLLQHVEKAVLGIAGLLFLLIVYSSLSGAKQFDKTPEELKTAISQGQKNLELAQPQPRVLPDYVAEVKRNSIAVVEKMYSYPNPWDEPLFGHSKLRDAPPLFTIEKLSGTAAVGCFAIKRTLQPGEIPPVVTPRTPKELRAAAVEPVAPPPIAPPTGRGRRAIPEETAEPVEQGRRRPPRAREIPPPDMAEPTMEDAPVAVTTPTDVQVYNGVRWVVITGLVPWKKQQDACIEAYRSTAYFFPSHDLPNYLCYWVRRLDVTGLDPQAPLDWEKAKEYTSTDAISAVRNKWWQPESITSSLVAPQYLVPQQPEAVWNPLVFPLGPLADRLWDASVAHEPEVPLLDPTMPDMAGGGGIPDETTISANVPFDPLAPRKAVDANNAQLSDAQLQQQMQEMPQFKLFRHFDFDVEQGHRYVYRVRVAVTNPNYQVKATFLKDPALANDYYIQTPWSEPTKPIGVPYDTRIWVVKINPVPRDREPVGQLGAHKFDEATGEDRFSESPMARGQVANFGDGFSSEATIVDLRAERLPGAKSGVGAGEVLVLTPDGQLVVRDELEDAIAYRKFKDSVAPPTDAQAMAQ